MAESYPAGLMPGGLKGALVVVWLQAAVTLVSGLMLFNGDVTGSGFRVTAGWVLLGVAVLLAASALGTAAHQDWARRTVILLEVVNILSGVLIVLTGGVVPGLLGMAVSVAVIGGVGSGKAIAWVRRY